MVVECCSLLNVVICCVVCVLVSCWLFVACCLFGDCCSLSLIVVVCRGWSWCDVRCALLLICVCLLLMY